MNQKEKEPCTGIYIAQFANMVGKVFSWEMLCECETKEELDEMEIHYIRQYNSLSKNNGYNMTWGWSCIKK
jgi:hypothetical protein